MNDLTISRKEKWIPWIDHSIEGGILLFIFLFPVKEFIVSNDAISLIKWMALYLPFGLWLLKMVLRKDSSLIRTPIDLPILLYTIVVVASVFYSIDRIETLAGLRGSYLKAIVLYLVVLNNFRTEEKMKRLAVTFAASFVVTAGVGLYNYQSGQYNIAGGIIAFQNGNHNTMGKILGGSFPFLLLAFAAVKRPILKGIAMLFILLGLFAIFMTLSRATWAGAVFVFLIWGMYQNWKVMTAALVLFLITLFSFGPDSVARRFALLEGQIGTLSSRTPIWEVAIEQIKDRPLFGYGYGLSIFEKLWTEEGGGVSVPHEHNMILALLIQNGLAGLSLYLWIFVGTLVLAFRRIRILSDGLERNILIVIFSGIIGEYFVHAMFDRNNVGNWALPAWGMVAMVMVILTREADPSEKVASLESPESSAVDVPRDVGVDR